MIMSLTSEDLHNIESIVDRKLDEKLAPIKGELEAHGNDIKAIYGILDKKQAKSSAIKQYRNLRASLDNLAT